MKLSKKICIDNPDSECDSCELENELMCRFKPKSLLTFLVGFLVVGIPAFAGIILAGLWWLLIPWVVYMVFFLQVWENRILCSHCPYYASEGRTLRCHANYGLIKAWKYHPEPMSRSEQLQFLIGTIIFIAYPLPFLFLSQQFLLLVFTSIGILIFTGLLVGTLCPKCLNFSCPLNRVPKTRVDAFLRQNPEMCKAWEAKGYKLESAPTRQND